MISTNVHLKSIYKDIYIYIYIYIYVHKDFSMIFLFV